MAKPGNLKNLLLNAFLAGGSLMVLLWGSLKTLDFYTRHGEEVSVPDLSGLFPNEAESRLEGIGLELVITDSVYEITDGMALVPPGTVFDHHPPAQTSVKPGRKIYVTLRALGPPMIPVPDMRNVSLNLAQSELKELGFKVREVLTHAHLPPQTHKNPPVLEIQFEQKTLMPGEKIPKGSSIVIIVEYLDDSDDPLNQENIENQEPNGFE